MCAFVLCVVADVMLCFVLLWCVVAFGVCCFVGLRVVWC